MKIWTLLLFVGCKKEGEPEWVQFNDDVSLEVKVTDSDELGEPVVVDVLSTTGSVVIASASVDPGSGPVGTEHTVLVNVVDDYEHRVGRVVIETDSGERGIEEHELERDSADIGYWWLALTSGGTAGESRTDVFTFRLYEDQSDEE